MKDKKLVVVLVIIIVLLLIGGAYMFGVRPPNNYEVYKGGYPNLDNSQLPKDYSVKPSENDSWITDSKMGLTYNSKWQVNPQYYQSPAQQERGEPLSIVGYMFILQSGNTITWGGHQSGCTLSDVEIFKHEISTLACVKSMRANLGLNNVRQTLPQEDINSFGDFVLRNQ